MQCAICEIYTNDHKEAICIVKGFSMCKQHLKDYAEGGLDFTDFGDPIMEK